MMSEKQNKIIKCIMVGGVVLNTAMCLNLYQQVLSLQYQVSQHENDSMSAIQALSRYIWEMKNPDINGYFGDFQ